MNSIKSLLSTGEVDLIVLVSLIDRNAFSRQKTIKLCEGCAGLPCAAVNKRKCACTIATAAEEINVPVLADARGLNA